MTRDEVYDLWEPIAFPERHGLTNDDRLGRWEELYELCRAEGGWSCDLDSALMVGSTGSSLWLGAGNPRKVLKLVNACLAHPELKGPKHGKHVDVQILSLLDYRANACVLLGRKTEAYRIWRDLLDAEQASAPHFVRISLWHHLHSDLEGSPDEEIRGLVAALLGRFPGTKKIVKQVESACDNRSLSGLVDLMRGRRVGRPKR